MTEQSDESLDPKPESSGIPPASPEDLSENSSPQLPTDGETTDPEDAGLPEWEPLTPELVEDEAIRGDFVIRWFVVGLALLLGVSQIAETRTLLHLKNGQYLVDHGFLPGANDVFSFTANDRKWVNLSWLFDIIVNGVYTFGGGIGLSIFQGLITAITFGLLAHAVRPNIRTWWGSICAVLALLTCYSQFTIQPELVTLLGTGFFLWALVQSEEEGKSGLLWSLLPAIWLWAQLDQRAWFGWFLLVLWALGEWLTRETSSTTEKKHLFTVVIAAFVLVAVHPFLWETWLAPLRMYLTDYPAMRFAYQRPTTIDQVFFPLWRDFHWFSVDHRTIVVSHRTIAALILAAATVVTMILNRSSIRLSHLMAFAGFNTMSLFATHELAAASLVNCVICTLNAQEWFREKFGQVYSIDWRELLFSRGGRAVTVMSFFALAWLILSGRLDGPGGKRTGIGFDSHLANAMNDYRNLDSHLVDDHPFNFSIRQGDLMIWGGQKPFVDSRTGLYYGNGGDSNLLKLHSRARLAMQQKRELVEGSGEPTVWKSIFDKYQIRQAWPRLNGPVPPPDYTTFFDLLNSSDFRMTDLNSSTAVFLRTDNDDQITTTYLNDHPFDTSQRAFQTKPEAIDQSREWSKPATTYDNLFSLRRPINPSGIQAAQHYLQLAVMGSGFSNKQRVGCAMLAVRHANDGLRNEPNSPDGYRVLGLTYSILGQLEFFILGRQGPQIPSSIRYYQTIAAYQQARALQPDDTGILRQLLVQYELMGRLDSQLEILQKLKQLEPYSKSFSDEQRQERERIIERISRLQDSIIQIDAMVAKHLTDGADRFQVAVGAYQAGGLLQSIKILEDDAIYLAKNPQAKLMLANWLMEAGRGRDAAEIFESLENLAGESSYVGWRDPSAICSLLTANYLRSIKLWSDQMRSVVSAEVPQAMMTLPFTALGPAWISPETATNLGPLGQSMQNINAVGQLMQGARIDGSALQFYIALAQLESGSTDDAANSLRQSLRLNPNSALRPLFQFYLECVTGEKIESTPEMPQPEELTDLSEPEATPEDKPEAKSEEKQKEDKQN